MLFERSISGLSKQAQMSSATADVSDFNSDQLTPEQTAELRTMIEKHSDQISRNSTKRRSVYVFAYCRRMCPA